MTRLRAPSRTQPPSPAWWRHGLRLYWFSSAFGAGRFLPRYDFHRFVEHGLIYEHVVREAQEGSRILDVGSGYSLLPLALAARRRYVVYITDNEAFLPHVLDFHRQKLQKIGLQDDAREARIVVDNQDARRMAFPDAFFDWVTCVSMINVLREDGGSETMREIARVLRPGGRAIVTVPYGLYEERESAPWNPYFTRSYDDAAIDRRLLEPSGLSAETRWYFGDQGRKLSRMYWLNVPRPVRLFAAVTTPLWTRLSCPGRPEAVSKRWRRRPDRPEAWVSMTDVAFQEKYG